MIEISFEFIVTMAVIPYRAQQLQNILVEQNYFKLA